MNLAELWKLVEFINALANTTNVEDKRSVELEMHGQDDALLRVTALWKNLDGVEYNVIIPARYWRGAID